MRRPMIAGNWKMHKTTSEARELARNLTAGVTSATDRDIVVAPVFTSLHSVFQELQGTEIMLAGQNCYPEEQGAFTGEISPAMLKDAGCQYVILGHSERRQIFSETDDFINRKVRKAIDAGLGAILCVGETLEERETEQMLEVLTRQIKTGLMDLGADQMNNVVIAYEPVWAIGTGKTASDNQAEEAHSFIRGLVGGMFTPEIAQNTRILYGGSVKPANVDGLMAQENIDGALVGGASLKSEDFLKIIHFNN